MYFEIQNIYDVIFFELKKKYLGFNKKAEKIKFQILVKQIDTQNSLFKKNFFY